LESSILAKSNYTDEEINQFFQELFLEKKKSKELSESLQKLSLESAWLKKELDKTKEKSIAVMSKTEKDLETHQLKKLLAAFKAKYEKTLSEMKARETQFNEAIQEVSRLESKEEEIRSLTQQMATLKEYYLSGQEQIQLVKSDNEQLKKNLTQSAKEQAAAKASEQEFVSLNQTVQGNQATIAQYQSEAQKHFKDIEQLQRDLTTERQQCRELHALVQKYTENDPKAEIANLSENNWRLQKALDSAKLEADKKEKEFLELQTVIKKNNSKLEVLEQKNVDLVYQLSAAESYKDMTLAAQGRISEFEKQFKEAEEEIEQLKNEAHRHVNFQSELEGQLRIAQCKSKELEEQLQKNSNDLFNTSETVKASGEENQSLYKQIETLKHNLFAVQNESGQLNELHRTFEKQFKEAEKETEQLKNEAKIHVRFQNELEEQLRIAQFKSKELEEQLREQEEQLRKNSDEMFNTNESVKTSGEENQLLHKQIETLTHNLFAVQNELGQLNEIHRKYEGHFQENEAVQHDLRQKVHALEPELFEVKKAYQQSLKRIKEEDGARYEFSLKIQNLEHELLQIRKAYQQSLEKIQNDEDASQKLNTKIVDLEAELLQADSLKLGLAAAESQMEEVHLQLEESQAQNRREKQKIEKLVHLVKEREMRIGELQQIEISLKRTSELKAELENALEQESSERKILQEEKTKVDEELKENRQHTGQLERVIQFLRERSQEAQLELKQLREEYQNTQETVKQLNEQLKQSSADNLRHAELFQNEEHERKEAQEEINRLQIQFESLHQQIQSTADELEDKKKSLELITSERDTIKEEKFRMEIVLKDKIKCLETFEKEIGLIKQTLIRALREAKEIETSYHETVKEKVATIAKLHQSQHQIEKYREQESLLKNQLETSFNNLGVSNNAINEFRIKNEEFQQKLMEEKHLHAERLEKARLEAHDKAKEIIDLKDQMDIKEDEIDQLKGNLALQQSHFEENEVEMRKAQQHLAKKVKEMTILEDKQTIQNNIIAELQKNIAQDNIRIAELQTTLDLQIHQQKRLEDQLHETTKATELQQSKWEEKYFAVYEKWQGADARVKELEKLEDKYKQLQGLLSNLGTFIGETSGFIQPPAFVAKEPYKPVSTQETNISRPPEKSNEVKKPYQNLFDMPKAPPRPKQDLLDR